MHIAVRLLVGAGIFILGYYLGREVTRSDMIRKELGKHHSITPGAADS